ncbi:Type IV pilus prepilin leader peptidase [Candidatus Glomeribacter gigasporarum BEG34]|uniref:Prepilin leader peptidase/N-methyltransferase n=1 Tax=Candidatus Glomeribacter gigasporarum BEG34 TaxID=1070319 RepID=G2JAC6_9BURK|nr:A24 family peptidase [Candidatus Glomeribacter gigasporarum]CCD29727.1 Type IV pilus prepilin leader peptidase [Candidatus Glomeribacter gigasporarum BEG34]
MIPYFIATLFGLVIGSFLTVVVHRLPIMLERAWNAEAGHLSSTCVAQSIHMDKGRAYNLWQPRSHCPACGHTLRLLENIPLVSYLRLRGRCAACCAPIPIRYLLIELLSAISAASAFWRFGASGQALAAYGLVAALLALAWIDLQTHLLPDALTMPLLWSGLLVNLEARFAPLADAVIGALAGYLSLWLIAWLFRLVRNKEGMGQGDFKLLAALGAWFGWMALPSIALLASTGGMLCGVAACAYGRLKKHQPLPFGPFLAAAGALALFWTPPWMQWQWMPL